MDRKQRQKGFTLVEILIVVVILGILAAIVIPQFTNASESAKASSLISQLSTLRSQLELYQVQHNGNYPTTWAQLTQETEADDGDGVTTDGGNLGPYLQQPSRNPFVEGAIAEGDTISGDHWFYDPEDGEVFANMSSVDASKLTELGFSDGDGNIATSDPSS